MALCSSCCSVGYKRKVDAVFPRGNDAPDTSPMMMYAIRQPRKQRAMAKYLASRIIREIQRFPSRMRMVHAGVQGMDVLLQGCHANLSAFVGSYLTVLERLLESNVSDYQILGTASFVKFSKIEEPAPSYNRHYDFFVEKFSSMCYRNPNNSLKIRMCGVHGLRALFVKTADALWERDQLGKIVPALLHCITDPEQHPEAPASDGESEIVAGPRKSIQAASAECLHDLAARASVPYLRELLRPVFQYFADMQVWEKASAWDVYKGIIVPTQQETAISELVSYLDTHTSLPPQARGGIVKVLAAAVKDTTTAMAPFINVFQTLLKVLRVSAEDCPPGQEEQEKGFQALVLATLPTFVTHTLDKQKVDVMIFTLGKLATTSAVQSKCNVILCTLAVARTIKSLSLADRLPPEVLDNVLGIIFSDQPEHLEPELEGLRVIAKDLLCELLSVRMEKAQSSDDGPKLRLYQVPRADADFLRHHLARIHGHLYQSLTKLPNGPANYRASLAVLLKLSDFGAEELLDGIRMAFALLAENRSHLVAFSIVFLRFLARRYHWEAFGHLCDQLAAQRADARECVTLVCDDAPFAEVQPEAAFSFTPRTVAAALQPLFGSHYDVLARISEEYLPSVARIRTTREQPRRGHVAVPLAPAREEELTFDSFQKIIQLPGPESAAPAALEDIWCIAGAPQARTALLASILAAPAKGDEKPCAALSACALWNLKFPNLYAARISLV